MTEQIIKRSVVVAGHKTSVSLEDTFWQELTRMARLDGLNKAQSVSAIDRDRRGRSLSSSIRLAVVERLVRDRDMLRDTLKARMSPGQPGTKAAIGQDLRRALGGHLVDAPPIDAPPAE